MRTLLKYAKNAKIPYAEYAAIAYSRKTDMPNQFSSVGLL